MTAIALVAITMFVPHGPVTYCGILVADIDGPFLALPVSQHGVTWECGDRVGVKLDGELYFFDALDAGPFGAYCVRQLDGSCPRIAADLPQAHAPFPGLSAVGQVLYLEPIRERWEEYR